MQIQRGHHLKAAYYERTPERLGYANSYKAKRIDTSAETVTIQVPKTAGYCDDPFYSQSLDPPQ